MIGYWNIRTLRDSDDTTSALNAKYLQVEREMLRYNLSILGLSEVRWTGCGEYTSPTSETVMLYSGKDIGSNHESGVGIILTRGSRKSLIDWRPVSDRLILARFGSRVRNISVIQCYAPTEGATDDVKDLFYGQLNATYDSIPRGDIVIVMGDLNAKVGSDNESLEQVMGKHGLGTRNDNGDRFIDFCVARKLVIGGTLFQHKDCHKATWLSPDRLHTTNQIDHCAISHRYRKCLLDVRSRRGADIGQARDHYLVVAKIRLCTAAIRENGRNLRTRRYDIGKLRNPIVRNNFRSLLCSASSHIEDNTFPSIDAKWENIRDTIRLCADQTIGPASKGRELWMSEDTWGKIVVRKDIKGRYNTAQNAEEKLTLENEYRELHKSVQRAVRRDKRRYIDCLAEDAERAASSGDTRTVFMITRKLADQNMRTEHPIRDLAGNLLNTDHEQMERWREHFSIVLNSITQDATGPPIPLSTVITTNPRIRTAPPSLSEIIAAIRQLPNGKAAGTDGIPAEIYKCDPTLSAELLRPLITESWENECFPKEWKDGIITKIAKKGDLKNCGNWRGICVQPIIVKLISKIILNRIKEQDRKSTRLNTSHTR